MQKKAAEDQTTGRGNDIKQRVETSLPKIIHPDTTGQGLNTVSKDIRSGHTSEVASKTIREAENSLATSGFHGEHRGHETGTTLAARKIPGTGREPREGASGETSREGLAGSNFSSGTVAAVTNTASGDHLAPGSNDLLLTLGCMAAKTGDVSTLKVADHSTVSLADLNLHLVAVRAGANTTGEASAGSPLVRSRWRRRAYVIKTAFDAMTGDWCRIHLCR